MSILVELLAERELHFSQVGTNPKESYFSQEGTNPKDLGMFPKAFMAAVPYNIVHYSTYYTC